MELESEGQDTDGLEGEHDTGEKEENLEDETQLAGRPRDIQHLRTP